MDNNPNPSNTKVYAAIACGILSVVSFGAFPVPTILGILALVLGTQALKDPMANRKLAQISRVLGCVGILLPLIILLFLGVAFMMFL